MVSAIFSQALREHFRFKSVALWSLLAFLTFAFALGWPRLLADTTPEATYTIVSQVLVYHIEALASAILTMSVVSQEVERRTIVYLLTRPVPRATLLLSRYAASVVFVFLIGAFSALLNAAGSHYFGGLGRDFVALFLGAAMYGALFLAVSLLFNRATLICLLYAFGWELSAPSMPGELYKLSIFSYLQGIAQRVDPDSIAHGFLAPKTSGTTESWIVLIVGSAALLAFSSYWFTTNEFLPREDAE